MNNYYIAATHQNCTASESEQLSKLVKKAKRARTTKSQIEAEQAVKEFCDKIHRIEVELAGL